MPRTPLAQRIRDAYSVVSEAETRQVSIDQVVDEHTERRVSRRQWLRQTAHIGAAAAAVSAFPDLTRAASATTAPRIAIVGAGLAGLTCAFRLKQAGYSATVFEAADRVGGRCWTIRDAFVDGQIAEHGGELIDQGHTHIRQLAQELKLDLDNLLQAEQNGTEPFYYFDGAPYTYRDATNDLKAIWQKIHSDVSAASYPTLYNVSTERGRQLDQMSIIDWINESVPGGINSRLGQLLDVAYNIEYGAECSEQSSLNLLYLLGYSGQGQLRLFGPSNEKYHVRGGNDQITDRMAARLAGQIMLGHELIAIRRNANGSYTLSFRNRSDAVADKVVLALPFSILRSSVDWSKAGFKPLKQTAIRDLAMGTNSKLQLQFNRRVWRELGCNGDTYADTGYQASWEVTRAQTGRSGILVDYTGGNIGASFGVGTATTRARQFLGQIEPVLPGISAAWNGAATLDYWQGYRWTKGSYAYWKVGQYTRFAGVEGEREGNCHFAGEHTSIDFQGYLNGAVETGERAANEILADFKASARRLRSSGRRYADGA
jgi:monoamine oxidase